VVFLFRDKSVVNLFFLLLLSLAVHFHFFSVPVAVVANPHEGFISEVLIKYIKPLPNPVLVVVYHLLLLAQAFRLNSVLTNLRMFQQQGHTTAMAYVLFSGFFAEWSAITPALVANLLIIWIFLQLSKLYNYPSPKSLLFNVGLLSGITILCYHPTSILVCITIFALAIVRPFRPAEWVVLLMGLLIPFYFLGSYFYLTDNLKQLLHFLPSIHFHLPLLKADAWFWIGLSVLALSLFMGIYYWQQNSGRMIIQIRKNWGVMMVLLLLMLPIPFIFRNESMHAAVLCLVPLAAYVSNVYQYPKRLFLPNILFWLSVAVIVHNNYQLVKI
jgi:hypothetical protein